MPKSQELERKLEPLLSEIACCVAAEQSKSLRRLFVIQTSNQLSVPTSDGYITSIIEVNSCNWANIIRRIGQSLFVYRKQKMTAIVERFAEFRANLVEYR